MKALSKVEELWIKEATFTKSYSGENCVDFKLEHLTKLEINGSLELNVFAAFVPASLKILRLKSNNLRWREGWDAEVLGKQTRLEELYLKRFTINEFKFDPENCHIEKLKVQCLRFLNKSAFGKFSDLMKIQESVKELKFYSGRDELKTGDYTEILKHLFSLETLKKVTLGCEYNNEIFVVLTKISICNPVVETLISKNVPSGADFKSFSKFFPCVTDLKITLGKPDRPDNFFDNFVMDLKPFKSMKQIKHLALGGMTHEFTKKLGLEEIFFTEHSNYSQITDDS
jgi:hypothetical protein